MTHDVPVTLAQSWGLRDVGFSAAHVAAAASVAQRLRAGPLAPELIVVGGELALGLGHVNSTVELCVVGTDESVARHYDIDGTRVVLRPMRAEPTARLLALAAGFHATSGRDEALTLDAAALADLVALVSGRRLLAEPRWVEAFAAVSADAVRQLLITRNALAFAASAADAYHALLSGDLFTAVSASADALLTSAKAVLAAAGDLDPGATFVFRRLARTPVTRAWCGRIWQLVNCAFPAQDPPGPDAVRATVEHRLLVGNRLLALAGIAGWDKQLTDLVEPGPPDAHEPMRGPARSPYFVPVRLADGWSLLGPGAGYRTTEPVIRLWHRLAGQRPDDYTHELAGAEPELAGRSIVEIEAAVNALLRIGAVAVPPAWSDRSSAMLRGQGLSPALAIVRSSALVD